MEDQKLDSYLIPINYKVPGKWKRFYIRNLLEAGIAVFLIGSFVIHTRLIWQAKFILACLLCGAAAAVFVNGINDLSVSEFTIRYIRFIFRKYIKYHYKKPELIYGEIDQDRENGEQEKGNSNYERLKEKLTKRFRKGRRA